MSTAERDLRAALVADAALIALVGGKVTQNGVPEGTGTPYVVFTAVHAPELGLSGVVLADKVTFTIECWSTSALASDTIADAVAVALSNWGVTPSGPPDYAVVTTDYFLQDYVQGAAAIGMSPATVTGRASGFDGDLGLDATVMSVEVWA